MSRRKKKKKSKAQELIEYLLILVVCLAAPIIPLVSGFGITLCTPDNVEVHDIVIQDAWYRAAWGRYDAINTRKAGTLDFSGVPAFFVTMVLLVQSSAAIYAGLR